MMRHRHADAMALFAEDAKRTNTPWQYWEISSDDGETWCTCYFPPCWNESYLYRRILQTIDINGIAVSKPVDYELKYSMKYYIPILTTYQLFASYEWTDHRLDKQFLDLGLIHLTKENAINHAKALLSFTQK